MVGTVVIMYMDIHFFAVRTSNGKNHAIWTISNGTRKKLVRLKIIVDTPTVLRPLDGGTFTLSTVVHRTPTHCHSLLKHIPSCSRAFLL